MSPDDEVGRRIQRAFRDVSAPRPPVERVLRRGRFLVVRRYLAGSVLVAVLLAAVVLPLILLGPLKDEPDGITPATSPEGESTPSVSEQGWFAPTTYTGSDRVTMPVTFPDGSTADVSYPPELGLAEGLGIAGGSWAGDLGDRSGGCGYQFGIIYRREPSAQAGDAPVTTYSGADARPVELWRAGSDHPADFMLIWRFGEWVVWLPCDDAPEKDSAGQELWARSLRGLVTEDGFLVLESAGPLTLYAVADGGRPSLQLGGGGSFVDLSPVRQERCDEANRGADVTVNGHGISSRSPGSATFCEAEDPVQVAVLGDEPFVEAVIEGLHVHNVSLAPGP